ncbi:class I SAM-dependent methyltransferase [Leptothoe sp. PORK10 BA2]|uniref:class I SAM-dependent methyltransferase n=1 Tax=Leptothoe sp. PORK10 BA2 TaxID=3110254 RepID=UPI002B1FEB40|nr:class I SAM-dependent methyltransferase [Leptothoe sp. PORK10 BA2]MEA5462704.1 class I SAM-dependent methyltransferase [Leptothoe sp. PORK10 BA2]
MILLSSRLKEVVKRAIGISTAQSRILDLEDQVVSLQSQILELKEIIKSIHPSPELVSTSVSIDWNANLSLVPKDGQIETENEKIATSLSLLASEKFLPQEQDYAIKTMVCQHRHFQLPWFADWNKEINPDGGLSSSPQKLERKGWEYCSILQALSERGMLQAGKRGLGFAVGTEPLPAVFAKHGVEILATDLDTSAEASKAWQATNQHAGSLQQLWKPKIISQEAFQKLVRFQPADMNHPETITDKFDFIWSSCALEHLGGLQAGFDFILRSSQLLRPGGIAVHTTEFNVASNSSTITTGGSVIYRKCDIEALDYHLRKHSMCLEKMDFYAGALPADRQYDTPPYFKTERQHVKLKLFDHISTSLVLIVYR